MFSIEKLTAVNGITILSVMVFTGTDTGISNPALTIKTFSLSFTATSATGFTTS